MALAAMPIGQTAEVRAWRQNAEIVLRPVIGEMPVSPPVVKNVPRERTEITIGLNLAPLTQARRQLLGISPNIKGVIVLSIDDDSAFLGLGVRPGDVIETINQQPVTSPEDALAKLTRAMARRDDNLLMLVNRHGTNRDLPISPENTPAGAKMAVPAPL
jgi:serine protease Do